MTDQNRHSDTGQIIRALRNSTGLTQEKFAARVGLTRRHLIRLENGENPPSRSTAARIEKAVEELTGEPPAERIYPEDDDDEEDALAHFRTEMRELERRMASRMTRLDRKMDDLPATLIERIRDYRGHALDPRFRNPAVLAGRPERRLGFDRRQSARMPWGDVGGTSE